MAFPNELSTERLLLRPPTEADAERMFRRYSHDGEVCRYMSWKPHRSIDDTLAYLRQRLNDDLGPIVRYPIWDREREELLGSIGCRIMGPIVQFGYCLARDSWGRGIATEAAIAFVAEAFNQPEIWRVQAFCDLENRASARVLEKSGLVFEGTLRRYLVMPNLSDIPRDMRCYAKVREAPIARTCE